jgi:hypothetical protein
MTYSSHTIGENFLLFTPASASTLFTTASSNSLYPFFLVEQLATELQQHDSFWDVATKAQHPVTNDTEHTTASPVTANAKTESLVKKPSQVSPPVAKKREDISTPLKLELKRQQLLEEMASLQERTASPITVALPGRTVTEHMMPPVYELELNRLGLQEQEWLREWIGQRILRGVSLYMPTTEPLEDLQHNHHSASASIGAPDRNGLHPSNPTKAALPSSGPSPTERYAFLKALQEQIEQAYKQGKPFRVHVDNHTSVILTLKQGDVSARFLMNERTVSPAVVEHLNQQLHQLQHTLKERQLPVGSLQAEGGGQPSSNATLNFRKRQQSSHSQDEDA